MDNVTPISAAVSGNCADGYNYGNPGQACPPVWDGLANTGTGGVIALIVVGVALLIFGSLLMAARR